MSISSLTPDPLQAGAAENAAAVKKRRTRKRKPKSSPPAVQEAISASPSDSVKISATPAETTIPMSEESVPVQTDSFPAEDSQKSEKKKRSRGGSGRNRKKTLKAEPANPVVSLGFPAVTMENVNLPALIPAGESLPAIPSSYSLSLMPPDPGSVDNHQETAAAPPSRRNASKTKEASPANMRRKMFINVLAGEQVEVAIAEEGNLREYYVEMLHQAKIKGNIYKGMVHNVDPNLQAAFVSYGAAKNGFLQIDEVHPEYYLTPHEPAKGHKYPLIQKVLKTGQEILVQVVKEPSGSKGAFLTSYLSLPGRYLVLTPGNEQIGVSRKVGNDTERARLRELLDQIKPEPGLGVIVRTASEGSNKTSLQRDLRLLKRLWQDVRKKGSTENAPALIYQELGLAARAVRDYLTEDIVELWINDEGIAEQLREIITLSFPKRTEILQLHNDPTQNLFERFGLVKQISQVQSREVTLPSGGRLVFDHTEALTAIDINSGRSGGKNNFEDMAFKINLEAARHIPLQLRLRDIGGQIVVDFIEMRDHSHWREVEKTFRAGMKEDRARHDVGKISAFGLLEVVRQRLGSSAISIASEPCPHCKGTGIRRNMEWQAMQAMQEIQQIIRQHAEPGKTITYTGAGELIVYILNHKKEWLLDTEQEVGIKLELIPNM